MVPSRGAYLAHVRGFVGWLAASEHGGEPLSDPRVPDLAVLGGGKTIFPSDGRARQLELVSVTQAKTGVLICAYRPAGPAAVA